MKNVNLAAIDIGSNGARLLIKNVQEDLSGRVTFRKLMFLRVPLRLGMDVFTLGEVSKEKEEMVLRMMKGYKQFMKLYKVEAFRACATSAMRDARNGKKILKDIYKKTGVRLEILEGKEEARLLYNNKVEQVAGNVGNYAYVDVGGGSTEISLLHDGILAGSKSYNLGTVRMLSGAVADGTVERMKTDLAGFTGQFQDIHIIGSGGNINKLYRLSRGRDANHRLSGQQLPVETLRQLYDEMKDLSVQERMVKYSLKPDRADVIIPAAEIFLTVAEALRCEVIEIPNIGLADSIIDGLFKQWKEEEDF